jgi:hypothetical protein
VGEKKVEEEWLLSMKETDWNCKQNHQNDNAKKTISEK